MREAITPEPLQIEQRRTPGFVDNRLENGIGYVKNEDSDYTHYWTTDFGYAASGIAY